MIVLKGSNRRPCPRATTESTPKGTKEFHKLENGTFFFMYLTKQRVRIIIKKPQKTKFINEKVGNWTPIQIIIIVLIPMYSNELPIRQLNIIMPSVVCQVHVT